jgi:glycosyltransferase involved in cell wall biosynthesis
MNILHITNELDVGGITTYVLLLTASLKKRGHQVYIASSGGELLPRFIAAGVSYIPIPIRTKCEVSPKMMASLLKLLPVVRKNNIEIIHSHTRTTRVLGDLLAKKTSRVHLTTCHGFYKKRFSRRVFPCWGAKIIAISDPVREYLLKDRGVDAADVKLIYHGIDTEEFKINPIDDIKLRSKWGLGSGPLIGITSRLADVKGHAYLIKAMQSVLETVPSAQLIITGEGKMKKELIKLTKKLGLEKNILFIPSVLDPREVLSLIDIFVIPSLDEGLGLSLMEAMACGLPTIGSEVGGIKDLIQHGVNGLLVEPADVKGLASAILELLKDREKAKVLGNNARNFIKEKFTLEKMVSETERTYLECLAAKS